MLVKIQWMRDIFYDSPNRFIDEILTLVIQLVVVQL